LDASYARLPVKAMRIALLFASLENNGRIELSHWAGAQQITERWRADLHNLMSQLDQSEISSERTIEEKITKLLERNDRLTARQVSKGIRGLSSAEAMHYLDRLVGVGGLTVEQSTKTKWYSLASATRRCADMPTPPTDIHSVGRSHQGLDMPPIVPTRDVEVGTDGTSAHRHIHSSDSKLPPPSTYSQDWLSTKQNADALVQAMHLGSRAQALIDFGLIEPACLTIEQIPDEYPDKARLRALVKGRIGSSPESTSE
jgi:hypothetical protein